jgi:pilus assembly protein CpaC
VLGKKIGLTNLLLWFESGETQIINIRVHHDLKLLRDLIKRELPDENEIQINASAGTIVLSGNVSNTLQAKAVVDLTNAYLNNVLNTEKNNTQIINLIKINDPQQVLLEVVIASVDKNLLTQLGTKIGTHHSGSTSYSILSAAGGVTAATSAGSSFAPLSPEDLFLNVLISNGNLNVGVSADELQSMVRVLAKPNIVTISGQEGRFLKGGRTFIPVAQGNGSVSLQEEEFGVGVAFLPTVMDGGRIHLKVAPEVSSISSSTLASSIGGDNTTMPVFDTKSVSTTVQLNNGDTLMIGGLLDEETINSINGIPGLKDIPFFGALFRSQSSNLVQTELVVLVRTTLVAATQDKLRLPTDRVKAPTEEEFFIEGQIEGATN